MNPRFSIVVPAYNVEPYIGDCLRSLLGQGRDDIEIIVVNDGSTDSTAVAVGQFMKNLSPISMITRENGGLLSARRVGISHAAGDYILNVDGDDGLLPGALDVLSSIIDESGPDCILFGHTRKAKSLERPSVSNRYISRVLDRGSVVRRLAETRELNNVWSKCARRDCVGIDVSFSHFGRLQNGEDLVQSITIIERSRSFVEIEAPLYYYRANPQSITRTFRESDLSDIVVARQEVHAFLEREDADPELGAAAYAIDYMQAIDLAQTLCLSTTFSGRTAQLLDDMVSSAFYRKAVVGSGDISSLRADYRPLAPLLTGRRYGAFKMAARLRAGSMSAYRHLREMML